MDRLAEFREIVSIYGGAVGPMHVEGSDFAELGDYLAGQLHQAHVLVQQLEHLTKRRGFSNDPTSEVADTVGRFQRLLQETQRLLASLDGLKSKSAPLLGTNQSYQHKELVLGTLKSRLKRELGSFDRLMKAHQRQRQERDRKVAGFCHSSELPSPAFGVSSFPSSSSKERRPGAQHKPPSSSSSSFSSSDFALFDDPESGVRRRKRGADSSGEDPSSLSSPYGQAQMQGEVRKEDTRSLRARNQDLFRIEKSLSELSEMYRQFLDLLATQEEQVARLEDDVEEMDANTSQGLATLRSVLKRVQGERGLILKVFAVLVGALFVLVVFFR